MGRSVRAADSVCWLALVAAAFTGAQLLFVSRQLGLSWDEVVYVSQVSAHAPAAYFDPARARGIPLLVAPVAMLTSSQLVLRCYLSLVSGLALFLALLAWRRQRPGWLLALAGLSFAGLWVTQYYGPQAMPDLWVALSALAAAGFFLRAAGEYQLSPGPRSGAPAGARSDATSGARSDATSGARSDATSGARPGIPARGALAGLAGCLAATALVRPGDAVFLAGALVAAALAVPAWRQWPLLAATVAGLAAGSAEWIAEAYARFGGPLARLRAAGAEQGGFGFHLAAVDELRALNGPTLCRPCTAAALGYPVLSLWWLALPVLVVLGILAARRTGRLSSSLLAAWCGLCLAFQYLFLINYAAPRFLLPGYALLAIPVADVLGGLITSARGRIRPGVAAVVAVVLAAQLLAQHLVLDHEVKGAIVFHDDYARVVADLRHLGVRPPCLIKGDQDIPIAFYAGCGSAASGPAVAAAGREQVAVLERPPVPPPGYALHWRVHSLPGTRVLRLVGYLAPR